MIDHFLEPTFAGSRYFEELHPSDTLTSAASASARCSASPASPPRTSSGSAAGHRRARSARASSRSTRCSSTSGTSTRSSTRSIVRPSCGSARFAQSTFERVVVNGLFIGGTDRRRPRRQRRRPRARRPASCAPTPRSCSSASSPSRLFLLQPRDPAPVLPALAAAGRSAARRPAAAPRALLGLGRARRARSCALGYAIALVVDFDDAAAGCSTSPNETWIAELGIHYKLGVDGLNLFLVLLTTAAVGRDARVVGLATSAARRDRRQFFFHLALAHTAVLGALLAQDLALFVVFFDLMLVPFFFLTGQLGRGDRVAAVIKLFIYTLVGSLLMLAAAIATGVLSASGRPVAVVRAHRRWRSGRCAPARRSGSSCASPRPSS